MSRGLKYFNIVMLFAFLNCDGQKMIEPPGGFEIMKWYWNGFPNTNNGWKIEFREGMYVHGYTEGIRSDMVNVYCDTCGYLPKYSFDVMLVYGYDDKTELTVTQNKDTTDKYIKLEYPELYKTKTHPPNH